MPRPKGDPCLQHGPFSRHSPCSRLWGALAGVQPDLSEFPDSQTPELCRSPAQGFHRPRRADSGGDRLPLCSPWLWEVVPPDLPAPAPAQSWIWALEKQDSLR